MDAIYKIGKSMEQGDLAASSRRARLPSAAPRRGSDLKLEIVSSHFQKPEQQIWQSPASFTGTPLDERAFVSLKTARTRDEGDDRCRRDQRAGYCLAEEMAAQISSWGHNCCWQGEQSRDHEGHKHRRFWTRFSVLSLWWCFFGVASIMNLLVVEKTREIECSWPWAP